MEKLKDLEMLNKEKQSAISILGEKKTNELLTALDRFCKENRIDCTELNIIEPLYHHLSLLPSIRH